MVLNQQEFRASFHVFQDDEKQVLGRPKIWIIASVQGDREQDAIRVGREVTSFVASGLSLNLRIPFQGSGEFRIAQAATTEYGFRPEFDGSSLKGFTVLLEPPENDVGEGTKARQTTPLHQSVIGSITNEQYLGVFFADVIRQVDKNTNVSAEGLQISSSSASAVASKDTIDLPNELAVRVEEIYSDAMRQRDPRSQFLVLWSAVELLTNAVETQGALQDKAIDACITCLRTQSKPEGWFSQLLRVVLPGSLTELLLEARGLPPGYVKVGSELGPPLSGDEEGRMKSALKRIDKLTFREKVRISFEYVFGECRDGSDRVVASLRSLRGTLVHPRGNSSTGQAKLITKLTELRRELRTHLNYCSKTLDAPKDPKTES